MPLYSRTEDEAQARKVGATTALSSVNTDPDQNSADQPADKVIPEQYIYIDDVEATIPANRDRGLTAPGWWKYRTYTDHAGNTRHKAQHLVAFKSAPANTADTDDQYAADVIVTITISSQPEDFETTEEDGTALFSVTAVASPAGTLIYQWQSQAANGTRWTNITGATTDELELTGLTTSDSGKKYRVKITSSTGAPEVISDTAVLIVSATPAE